MEKLFTMYTIVGRHLNIFGIQRKTSSLEIFVDFRYKWTCTIVICLIYESATFSKI